MAPAASASSPHGFPGDEARAGGHDPGMLLLLPSDPLDPRRPDEHLRAEAVAARELGVPVALVDHDALNCGRVEDVLRRVPADPDAVYRGWMLRSEQYATLADLLAARDVTLRTSPEQYRRAHELPGWAGPLAAVTPRGAWTTGPDLDAFDACCAQVGPGPAVLRDYSKSLKHDWDEAAWIPDCGDRERARAVARRFLELRGDDLVGGLVVRAFETFVSPEARTWWVDGRCVLVGAHPDTPDDEPSAPDLSEVAPLVAALGLPFVTVDVVLRDDGRWRVVELGDGQVSDRPRSMPADALVEALRSGGAAV